VRLDLFINGLILFALKKDQTAARALLLNGNAVRFPLNGGVPNPMQSLLPGPFFHNPILVCDEASVDKATLPQLASVDGLIDAAFIGGPYKPFGRCEKPAGFYLSGLSGMIGDKGGPLSWNSSLPPARHPESFEKGKWDSLGWAPSLNDILPGCTLKPEFMNVGKRVNASFDLRGSLSCAMPTTDSVGVSIWRIGNLEQAVSDVVVLSTTLPDGILNLSDQRGSQFQLKLKATDGQPVRAWMSNEVGPREGPVERHVFTRAFIPKRETRSMMHMGAYYDAVTFSGAEPSFAEEVRQFDPLFKQSTGSICASAQVEM